MKFDDLDAKMRVFETARDYCVLPELYMVARLDGRTFTRLTKEVHKFKHPFDEQFRDMMLATVEHLMTSAGFRFVYGYTQSDEISLLFHPDETAFGRKTRKLNSVLAGEASAKFSLLLGDLGVFDSRISELPNIDRLLDYFRWRQEDAHRNSLNAHCYWLLRDQGYNVAKATDTLAGMSVAAKNELLFQNGVNFDTLPAWQKRGVGVFWETYEKTAVNGLTGESVIAIRNRLTKKFDIPIGEDYGTFIHNLLIRKELS